MGGNITLNRNFEEDLPRLKKYLPKIANEFSGPFVLAIYPEGTRQTKEKMRKAHEFAKKRGLTQLENLLQPRVKGFRILTNELRQSAQWIIDITTYYHPKPPPVKQFFLEGRLNEFCYFFIFLIFVIRNNIQ